MATGIIKFFKEDKGFGFIKAENGQEYFVHIKAVQSGYIPNAGDQVTFKTVQGKKGTEAAEIRLSGTEAPAPSGTSFQLQRHGGMNEAPQVHVPPAPGVFPYTFVRRRPGKSDTTAFHHQLNSDSIDVAFDITWTTETPTALQPCEDVSLNESAIGQQGENTGYNKRWLMMGDRPAISPFTVKGAVANGIANLLGGCYRVPDREEGHNHAANASTYPYTGKWKRYRVSMNGKSLPGIIHKETNLDIGYVKVQPTIEYYLDVDAIPDWLKPGTECQASWVHPVNKKGHTDHNKRIITPGSIEHHTPSKQPDAKKTAMIYYGPYRFGMDLQLKPGDMGKNHHHRFYSHRGGEIDGTVPMLSLATQRGMLGKVYGGQYCKGELNELKVQRMREHLGQPWYENLRELQKGDWCYYTAFDNEKGEKKIAAIGKNFQFKALFDHTKVLPLGNETCTDKRNLCPRCSLFGLAEKGGEAQRDAVGYAGRFKSAALVSDLPVAAGEAVSASIPAKDTLAPQRVQMAAWHHGERLIIRQFALPIMGPPKPSKRDMNGYFDEKTGLAKGAKRYHHAALDFDSGLPNLIAHTDHQRDTEEGMPYAHQMRPVVAVCREGISFSGTVGAENCSSSEVAALIALLDNRVNGHAFKLGLGKNTGLGTVSSRISRIWFRKPAGKWHCIAVPSAENSRKELFAAIKGDMPELLEDLKKIINTPETASKLHQTQDRKPALKYAKAGLAYWKDAKVETI